VPGAKVIESFVFADSEITTDRSRGKSVNGAEVNRDRTNDAPDWICVDT
jgi:hypothetical protein